VIEPASGNKPSPAVVARLVGDQENESGTRVLRKGRRQGGTEYRDTALEEIGKSPPEATACPQASPQQCPPPLQP